MECGSQPRHGPLPLVQGLSGPLAGPSGQAPQLALLPQGLDLLRGVAHQSRLLLPLEGLLSQELHLGLPHRQAVIGLVEVLVLVENQ